MAGGFIGSIVAGAAAPLAQAAGAIIPGILDIVKRYIPDPVAQAKIQQDLTDRLLDANSEENKLIMEIAQQQTAINLVEAQSPNWFANAWRPAAAWACVAGLWYSFLVQPIFGWGATMVAAAAGAQIPSPPVLNTEVLMGLLTGLLGLGGFRAYEKVSGAAAPEPGSPMKTQAIRNIVTRR